MLVKLAMPVCLVCMSVSPYLKTPEPLSGTHSILDWKILLKYVDIGARRR
jgi:hypothetical protein